MGSTGLTLVSLPETTVKEAEDRVRSAIINSGYTFPAKKITINLAPADLPKEGGRYDLPIAIALLAASGQLNTARLEARTSSLANWHGALRGVPGAISGALEAIHASRQMVANENASVSLIAEKGAWSQGICRKSARCPKSRHTLSPGQKPEISCHRKPGRPQRYYQAGAGEAGTGDHPQPEDITCC